MGRTLEKTITPSKLLSLPVVVVGLFLLPWLFNSSGLGSLPVACLVAALGLALVWFPEVLADTGFQRGIAHSSPAALVAGFGWLFLLGYPVLLLVLLG